MSLMYIKLLLFIQPERSVDLSGRGGRISGTCYQPSLRGPVKQGGVNKTKQPTLTDNISDTQADHNQNSHFFLPPQSEASDWFFIKKTEGVQCTILVGDYMDYWQSYSRLPELSVLVFCKFCVWGRHILRDTSETILMCLMCVCQMCAVSLIYAYVQSIFISGVNHQLFPSF